MEHQNEGIGALVYMTKQIWSGRDGKSERATAFFERTQIVAYTLFCGENEPKSLKRNRVKTDKTNWSSDWPES